MTLEQIAIHIKRASSEVARWPAWKRLNTMSEAAGPIGFQHIETAPRDGRFVRLRFRPALWMPAEHEVVARWEPHAEMKVGGWWFTADGGYVSPGPLFWAPSSLGE